MSFTYYINNSQLQHNLDQNRAVTFYVVTPEGVGISQTLDKPTEVYGPVTGNFISATISGDTNAYVPQLTENKTAAGYVVFEVGANSPGFPYELSNSAAGFVPLGVGSLTPSFPINLKNNIFFNKSTFTVTLKISNKDAQLAPQASSTLYDSVTLTNISIDSTVYSYDGSASGGAAATLPKGSVIYVNVPADSATISLSNDIDTNVYTFSKALGVAAHHGAGAAHQQAHGQAQQHHN